MKRVDVNVDYIYGSVCNNKQRWNDDKCRRECKELIDKVVWDEGFIWILLIVSAKVINHVMLVNI